MEGGALGSGGGNLRGRGRVPAGAGSPPREGVGRPGRARGSEPAPTPVPACSLGPLSRPRGLPSQWEGVQFSSRHPNKRYPTLSRQRMRSQCHSCERNRDSKWLRGPAQSPRLLRQTQAPLIKSLGAQMTGVDKPALTLGSLQALQSAPLSRCDYPLVSGCIKAISGKRKSSAFRVGSA